MVVEIVINNQTKRIFTHARSVEQPLDGGVIVIRFREGHPYPAPEVYVQNNDETHYQISFKDE